MRRKDTTEEGDRKLENCVTYNFSHNNFFIIFQVTEEMFEHNKLECSLPSAPASVRL